MRADENGDAAGAFSKLFKPSPASDAGKGSERRRLRLLVESRDLYGEKKGDYVRPDTRSYKGYISPHERQSCSR